MNSSSQRRTDEQIARIASRQGGTIARWQLLRLGLTANDIQYRITIGRLRVIHRGVYAVGHDAIPVRGRLFAALLLARPERGLSHAAATALHKLIPSVPPIIDVTVTAGRPRDRPGVVFHKAATLELTTKHGLPVTSVARTLQDLAATDRRTCARPSTRPSCSAGDAGRAAPPNGPGAAILKRLAGLAPTRSGLERRS